MKQRKGLALAVTILACAAGSRAQLAPGANTRQKSSTAIATNQTAKSASGRPQLTGFSPQAGAQGATVTLTFTGTNFQAPARLLVSPSAGLTVTSVAVSSPNQIQATVQIDPAAQTGARRFTLLVHDHELVPSSPFTITAAQAGCAAGTLSVNCQPGTTGQAAAPVLRGYAPTQGAQGSTVTLGFGGANFTKPGQLRFNPPTGLTVTSVNISPSQIQAQVQIAAHAPLGPRGVLLLVADHLLPAEPPFTVVAGQSACGGAPPAKFGIAAEAANGIRPGAPNSAQNPCPGTLSILRITPNQIAAGSQDVDLRIEGANFAPGAQAAFSTESGALANVFAQGAVRYVNGTEIHVTVNVSPAAIPGGRDITITDPNRDSGLGRGLLDILPAPPAKPGAPPKPKIIPIGFQKFPEGKINLQAPMWGTVYNGPDGGPENYGIPPLDDETVFQWQEQNPGTADYFELRVYANDGKTLVGKKRIDGTTVTVNGKATNLVPTYYRADPAFLNQVLGAAAFAGLPPLVFTQPSQPASNGKVLKGFGIGFGSPASLLGGGSQQVSTQGGGLNLKPIREQSPGGGQANSGPQIPPGDLQWEVAGFRTYNKDGSVRGSQNVSGETVRAGADANLRTGGTPATPVDVEVEISDRWALSATAFPTGLANCGLAAASGKGLNPLDVDAQALGPWYPGDRVTVTGNFDLSRSPYATHPKPDQAPCQGQCLVNGNPVSQFHFDNLFVDWGDGTVRPVSAAPHDPQASQWNSNVELTLPDCETGPSCASHRYAYPGQYTIRVFQLSDQDVQQVQASLVAASVDGPATSPFLATAALQHFGGNLMNMANAGGTNGSAGQAAVNSLASSGPSPSDVAGRAYMIFCDAVTVSPVQDPLATGPLYLRGISDPDFPGHDVGGGLVKKGIGGRIGELGGGTQSSGGMGKIKGPIRMGQESQAGAKSAAKGVNLRPSAALQGGGGGATPVAICSACDDSLEAQSKISFVGYGPALITWRVDGQTAKTETMTIGPSDQRTNLTRKEAEEAAAHPDPDKVAPTTWREPAKSGWLPVLLKPSADHSVWVDVQVVPWPAPPPNIGSAISGSLHSILDPNLAGSPGEARAGSPKDKENTAAQTAQAALNMLSAPANSGLPPLKIGFLSPSNHSSGGLGPVQYVNGPLAQVAKNAGSLAQKPGSYVSSKQVTYEVTEADPKQPCKFFFPVKDGGTFEVTGLQNHVTQSGGKWNGTGMLKFGLVDDDYAAEISIQDWQVGADGTVQSGAAFDAGSLGLALSNTPSLQGTIDRLRGTAGDVVKATLSVHLTDNSVTLAQGGGVPKWAGVEARLSSAGDWYATGLALPLSMLGATGFTVQASDVRLDLSRSDGDAPASPCAGGSGKQWLGVRLTNASVTPFTFNFQGSGSGSWAQTVKSWGFDNTNAICGVLDSGAFKATVEEGSVKFQNIHFTASRGAYEADYKQVDVHVPWLNTDLTGDAQLLSGGGKATNDALSLSGSAQPLNYKNVLLKTSNLQFLMLRGIDLAVQADTEWDLSAESKPFAQIKTRMYFGMSGRAYFKQGNPTQDVTLGGTSTLGQTPLELASAHLSAPGAGTDMLDFAVQTKLHLSEVMPATDVQVNYGMSQPQPGQYVASGPSNAPFMVDVPYPPGQPSSEGKVHPTYKGSGGNGGDAFSGTVDLAELGGPPVTGEFRLGYRGGHDYWLTRVTIGLGQEGVPLIPAPPVMNLYAIRGGLGHNFPINAFSDAGSIMNEQPSMDDSYLFMAGLRVGMPDQFTYTLDGNLTIEATGPQAGARMDFHAWLLTDDHSGNGQFQGYFQYAGGSFDGRLWGGLDFMGGLASFSLGNSANNAAVDLHFSGGSWHIYAGNKNGQRIQAHFIVANANSYLMLGSDVGLAVGGDENFCLCIGDDSVASAYIKGDLDVGVQITPQPHFIGDASADLAAGVCAFDACIDGNVSVQVHLEALPLDMHGTASLTLPIPFWNPTVSFSAHI